MCNVVSVVYFALAGSAVEILKEWSVTGKKKVRVRRFRQRGCGGRDAPFCLLTEPVVVLGKTKYLIGPFHIGRIFIFTPPPFI